MRYGGQSAVAPLRKALLRRPSWRVEGGHEYWRHTWGYERQPDAATARAEHDRFAGILSDWGADVCYLEGEGSDLCDSVFVHDRALVTNRGAIILRSGKPSRVGESDLMERGLEELGIPIIHRMPEPMTADGGDFLYLREDLLLCGYSYRTNAGRNGEFRDLLRGLGIELASCAVPYWSGPGDVMHLTSFISLVDHDLAVAYRRIMSVELVEFLDRHGVRFVDVGDEEFDMGLGANVLAVAPRKCVMLKDYPGVRRGLERAGAEVRVYEGREVSHCMKGGATCMTLALLRSDS